MKSADKLLIPEYNEPANNSNSNVDSPDNGNSEYMQVKDYYHLNSDQPEDSPIYEPVEINRTENIKQNGLSPSDSEEFAAPKRENPFNRIANEEDFYDVKRGPNVSSLVKQLGGNPPFQPPPRLPGAVGTPFLGKSRVPPIGAEQSPTESDEARQRPNPTWPDGGLGEPGEGADKTIWEANMAYAGRKMKE